MPPSFPTSNSGKSQSPAQPPESLIGLALLARALAWAFLNVLYSFLCLPVAPAKGVLAKANVSERTCLPQWREGQFQRLGALAKPLPSSRSPLLSLYSEIWPALVSDLCLHPCIPGRGAVCLLLSFSPSSGSKWILYQLEEHLLKN